MEEKKLRFYLPLEKKQKNSKWFFIGKKHGLKQSSKISSTQNEGTYLCKLYVYAYVRETSPPKEPYLVPAFLVPETFGETIPHIYLHVLVTGLFCLEIFLIMFWTNGLLDLDFISKQ